MSTTAQSYVSLTQVTYCGVPADGVYRYCKDSDPTRGVRLNAENDCSSKSQLSLAILTDFLEDSARAARLYSAVVWEIRNLTPADRPWLLTEADMQRAVDAAERALGLFWIEEEGRYHDEPVFKALKVSNKRHKEERGEFCRA